MYIFSHFDNCAKFTLFLVGFFGVNFFDKKTTRPVRFKLVGAFKENQKHKNKNRTGVEKRERTDWFW